MGPWERWFTEVAPHSDQISSTKVTKVIAAPHGIASCAVVFLGCWRTWNKCWSIQTKGDDFLQWMKHQSFSKFKTLSVSKSDNDNAPVNNHLKNTHKLCMEKETKCPVDVAVAWLRDSALVIMGWRNIPNNQLPSGKLTWQWKMDLLKMYSLLKMVIFHCHVRLLDGSWSLNHKLKNMREPSNWIHLTPSLRGKTYPKKNVKPSDLKMSKLFGLKSCSGKNTLVTSWWNPPLFRKICCMLVKIGIFPKFRGKN